MFKHLAFVVGLSCILAGSPGAFSQAPAKPKDSSAVRPVEVHVADDLIPRQQPRSDDWPMNGYDAGNTFCNRHEKTLAPPLEKVWEAALGGHVEGVAVSSGILLAAGVDGQHKVRGLDAQNG